MRLKKFDCRKTLFGLFGVLAVCGLIAGSCSGKEEKKEEGKKVVLKSSLAGRWYPGDAETLRKQIAGFFDKADVKPRDNVIALILPHAGYRYSGRTAVMGVKTARRKYKRIVVIGPSHRVPMEEILSVPQVTHYETSLGQIPLDLQFIEKLLKHPIFQNVPRVHQGEHSVQIELPLLQYCQQDFKLVPIVAGRCSLKTIGKAGSILSGLIDGETLVIASSDFVHYGPSYGYVPFTENIPEQIRKLDMWAYKHIAGLDWKGFLEYRRRTGATICGYVPVAVVLSMLEKGVDADLVKYATSGELTGDFTSSVSYLAVAFSGQWRKHPEIKPSAGAAKLTEQDRERLLRLARRSIVHFLKTRRVPEASELGVEISDAMQARRAAFVTLKLKKNSHLRGCIGDILPRQPLYRSVMTNAINAAVNDRRFRPVTEEECADITIELSVLTVPEPVDSPDKIRIGTDGVILKKNDRSAVYLPQVAPQQGWDVSRMLTRLSVKAGMAEDAWKEGASFLVFQADVFGESEK